MKSVPQKIVLASSNQGKLKELQSLFAQHHLPIEVVPQSVFNVGDADETGLSFIENAILKARHAAALTGLPALADDSGLSVDILQGAPGIYSARYAGEHGNDIANNAYLLQQLLPYRTLNQPILAQFICVLAFVKTATDPIPIIAQGTWHGQILAQPQGDSGFGYDPLFYLPQLDKSSAQLLPQQKNQLSHRALALQQLIMQLK